MRMNNEYCDLCGNRSRNLFPSTEGEVNGLSPTCHKEYVDSNLTTHIVYVINRYTANFDHRTGGIECAFDTKEKAENYLIEQRAKYDSLGLHYHGNNRMTTFAEDISHIEKMSREDYFSFLKANKSDDFGVWFEMFELEVK